MSFDLIIPSVFNLFSDILYYLHHSINRDYQGYMLNSHSRILDTMELKCKSFHRLKAMTVESVCSYF